MTLPKFLGTAPLPGKHKLTTAPLTFHAELKKRIQSYFEKRNTKSTGNWKLYSKALLLLLGYVAVYIHLVFFTPWVSI
jgi:linoleoyl-CoA desaturase